VSDVSGLAQALIANGMRGTAILPTGLAETGRKTIPVGNYQMPVVGGETPTDWTYDVANSRWVRSPAYSPTGSR
jgi:hypothetical protein